MNWGNYSYVEIEIEKRETMGTTFLFIIKFFGSIEKNTNF
jgi:hypothetical protein